MVTGISKVESDRILALHRLGVLDSSSEERFERVTRLAQRIFDVPMVSITLVDVDRQWRKAFVGLDGPVARREGAFCDFTIREDRTFVVEDAALDARFTESPFVVGDPHVRFYAGHPLAAPSGELVGTLCVIDSRPRMFDQADRVLLRDLALWVQGELQRDEEIDRAGAVQRSLLPQRVPLVDGFEVAARCLPARGVGGDFYDWLSTEHGTAFILADVMGKGMSAAIIAASARATLRAAVREQDLVAGVRAADAMLMADLQEIGSFITVWCGRIDAETARVTFVDAGHGLASVLRADGTVTRLRGEGLPLGIESDVTRAAQDVVLGEGDRLVVVSDGLVDLLAGFGVPGGDPLLVEAGTDTPGVQSERLAWLVSEIHRAADAQGTLEALMKLADGRYIPDDLTVLVVQRVAR